MKDLSILIAELDGQLVAFDCRQVDYIIEIEEISPVPKSCDSIIGVTTLRSRILTVVDLGCILTGERFAAPGKQQAIAITEDRHQYALTLDRIIDIRTQANILDDVPLRLASGWKDIVDAAVEAQDGIVPLLDVKKIIALLESQARSAAEGSGIPNIHQLAANRQSQRLTV